MGEGVLPTVQVLSEVAKTRAERGEMCHETPRNKDAAVQGHDKGTEGRGGCSSLRVRGRWMLAMISRGVEISIAGGVGKMVRRDPNSCPEGALI